MGIWIGFRVRDRVRVRIRVRVKVKVGLGSGQDNQTSTTLLDKPALSLDNCALAKEPLIPG